MIGGIDLAGYQYHKQPAVYILANKAFGTIYLGVTSNLAQRIYQHRNSVMSGFSDRYSLYKLVYFEMHEAMADAIAREKAMKKWNRPWKIKRIVAMNPEWRDLYDDII